MLQLHDASVVVFETVAEVFELVYTISSITEFSLMSFVLEISVSDCSEVQCKAQLVTAC